MGSSTIADHADQTSSQTFGNHLVSKVHYTRSVSSKPCTQKFDMTVQDSESEDDTFFPDQLTAGLVATKHLLFDMSTMDSDSGEDNFCPSDVSVDFVAITD